MAEQHEQLQADLAELRRQLETTPNIDSASRSLIERTIADVEKVLADQRTGSLAGTGSTGQAGRGSLAGRLAEAAKRFEATHPTLSGTVGGIIDALAQMGI